MDMWVYETPKGRWQVKTVGGTNPLTFAVLKEFSSHSEAMGWLMRARFGVIV